jgi:hypothetical protein
MFVPGAVLELDEDPHSAPRQRLGLTQAVGGLQQQS